jgi:hypothetical protein
MGDLFFDSKNVKMERGVRGDSVELTTVMVGRVETTIKAPIPRGTSVGVVGVPMQQRPLLRVVRELRPFFLILFMVPEETEAYRVKEVRQLAIQETVVEEEDTVRQVFLTVERVGPAL